MSAKTLTEIRESVTAERTRLEAELEHVTAVERALWASPKADNHPPRRPSASGGTEPVPVPASIATLAPATEGPIVTLEPTGRKAVLLEATSRKAVLFAYITSHPDTTMRQFADEKGVDPTKYYRAAQQLVDSDLIAVTSKPGETMTYGARPPS